MQIRIRVLFILSCIAIAGIITMQALWVANYYHINRQRFQREIAISFDKAVKKEFQIRNDSLEELLYRFVLDTNNLKVHSTWNKYSQVYVHTYESQNDNTPNGAFISTDAFNKPITSQTDTNRYIVARLYARSYRQRDLDNNIIHYDRQNIGKFLSKSLNEYEFDTNSLKKIYTEMLAAQDIHDPFYFQLTKAGDTAAERSAQSKGEGFYTDRLPTYDISYAYGSIAAVFPSADNYLLDRLLWIIISSVLLFFIVGFALFYMVRLLQKEKNASSIKNDFINNITHELKTPIATISTAIEAFEHFDALDDPRKTKKYLQTSRQQLNRLSDLVTKVLNISIYERLDFEIKKEPVQLDNLVQDLLKNFSVLHGDKLSIRYESNLPGITVNADRANLYSALSNIIDNAVKYAGKEPGILIRSFMDGRYCIIEVHDNGIGIKKEDLPKIFDKFYRVPAPGRHVKGYGLGLFYVKTIVEKHKGWHRVESEPGAGSVFKLALPND